MWLAKERSCGNTAGGQVRLICYKQEAEGEATQEEIEGTDARRRDPHFTNKQVGQSRCLLLPTQPMNPTKTKG